MPLTKKEINEVQLEPPNDGLMAPVIPTWQLRVNGRQFGKFMSIARQKPRRSIFSLPIADPCSTFANIWGTIATAIDFTYTAFIVALSLAFTDYNTPNAYWYLDFIGSAIYFLDLLIEFHVGFLVRWDASSVTITDGIEVAKNYSRNGTLWIDIIACLPMIGQIAIAATDPGDMSNSAIRVILLLKLVRLGRVIRLIARMNKFENGSVLHQWLSQRVNSVVMFACNTFFSLMILINLLACLWWWIAVTEGLENSWVAAVAITKPDIDLENGSDSIRWLVCAYYSLVTMATIGYGDIVPVTTAEIGLVIAFIFSGVAFFGWVVSTLKGILENSASEDSLSSGDYTKFQEMENWMKRFSFPKSLERQIRGHCYSIANSSTELAANDADFYQSLPLWLKVKVALELQKTGLIALVGGDHVWQNIPEDTRNAVAKIFAVISEPELVHSNIKLYGVGEKGQHLCFLEEGQINVFVPGVPQVVTITSPAIIGTGSVFGSWSEECSTWKATGRTASRCFIWKVNSEMLEKELLAVAPEFLQLIAFHYLGELKKTRAQLDRFGVQSQTATILALKQSYDVRIDGAQRAYDDLQTRIDTMKNQPEGGNEVAIDGGLTADMNTETKASMELRKLASARKGIEMNLSSPLPVVAGDVPVESGVAARLLELELENNLATDIDLEHNGAGGEKGIAEKIGDAMARRQQSMYEEEEQATKDGTKVAFGLLRKESNNTTYVV